MGLTTPVALFVFNRPETTERVFAEIRRAQPAELLVVADGPRADRPGEAERCAAARAIATAVDWDCRVHTNFAGTNMGVNARVVSGLNWVFEQVEEAIILEDDCLPHPSFFPYCEELLARYRDDERILMISGENKQDGRRRLPYSYYYSRLFHIYGWATWRRAWRQYDFNLTLWPEIRDGGWLHDMVGYPESERLFHHYFEGAWNGTIPLTWDFRWNFSCWLQGGLSIAPSGNLVTNIGFGEGATNASDPASRDANRPVHEMAFPLNHPSFMVPDKQADRYTLEREFTFPDAGTQASSGTGRRRKRKLRRTASGRKRLGKKARMRLGGAATRRKRRTANRIGRRPRQANGSRGPGGGGRTARLSPAVHGRSARRRKPPVSGRRRLARRAAGAARKSQ